ncbi:MAG: DUF1993 domain-containing protein [Gammaproteobacteria bacterium]|nr:DUF1993 domain-containing protein [Gammaproteobacteria bacterium]
MNSSIYDQVVVGFRHTLQNLAAMLEKAQQHAETNKYELSAILNARLYPDMFTCSRQIQLATDFAKGAAARLAGVEVPKWDDTEVTHDELQARIKKALDFLGTLKPEQFADAATRAIEIKTPVGAFNFTGKTFLLHWAVPNFYFHVTTAYNLLRHNGVPVAKFDFLGKI